MPLSTTPITREPKTAAADRNSTSAAGRTLFSLGPDVVMRRSSVITRCRSGGAMYTRPGRIGSPSVAYAQGSVLARLRMDAR
jgi:hypothetical protein